MLGTKSIKIGNRERKKIYIKSFLVILIYFKQQQPTKTKTPRQDNGDFLKN